MTRVKITNDQGANAIGKHVGNYITMDIKLSIDKTYGFVSKEAVEAYKNDVLKAQDMLVNATGEARITVEEADGSTTAISNISADGVAMKADGWYTVNGVKLPGMPTEKGIYINNGKKVVIK